MEIRPNASKTTENKSLLQFSKEMVKQERRFGQNSCTADKQACVFGIFEF